MQPAQRTFIFSLFSPRQNPDIYGMAVWDASGTLILTHETRTLGDVVTIGTAGVDASSGYNINTTRGVEVGLHARHARPDYRGYFSGGQPQPYSAIYKSMAKLEGEQYADICQTSDNPNRESAKRRVLKHEKRHHGH